MLRFAPSQSRDMHIQDLRVAILNYLTAQQQNEKFLLRIDDLDKDNNIEGQDTLIVQILEKFAIKDDIRYHQSEHLNIYQTLALRLIEEQKAYMCICQSKKCQGKCKEFDTTQISKIKDEKTPFVIRLNTGDIILDNKANPTSNFATACADMLDDISTVISNKNDMSNITIQKDIKELLGYQNTTTYICISDIKLDDTISLEWMFKEGFIPDAILNYLLLLGYKEPKDEIFTLPDAISWYDITNINEDEVLFDIEKLKYINQQHLKAMDDKELSKVFGFADADIGKLAKLYLKECYTINELQEKIKAIFAPKILDENSKKLQDIIFDAPFFDTYEEFEEYIIKHSDFTKESLQKPLGILLSGSSQEIDTKEIYPLIKFYLLEVIS